MSEYTPTRQELIAAWIIAHQEEGWGGQVDMGGSPKERIAEAHRGIAEVERAAAEKVENERDCLRFELDGFRRVAEKDNEFLIGERDAALSTIAKVETLHRRSHAVFSWRDGLRFEDPCPDCDGKAGVHPCGCWADVDTEFVCSECYIGTKGQSVPWPCPTARALGSVPSTGEGNE